MSYVVLIPCRNDKTGRRFEPGDVVDDGDFPAAVIKNWLTIDPPVLTLAFELDGDAVDEEE